MTATIDSVSIARGRCVRCGDGSGEPTFCSVSCCLHSLDERTSAVAELRGPGFRCDPDAIETSRRRMVVPRLLDLTAAEVRFAQGLLAGGRSAQPDGDGCPLQDLTPQLATVFLLVGDGFHNREVADMLEISPNTVRNYVSAILSRRGLCTRTDIASSVSAMRTRLQCAPETVPALAGEAAMPQRSR
jgi:DNA-binding CsgD family transcriptional regulator